MDKTAQDRAKAAAAQKAVDLIANGSVVGLGTGSTALHAIQFIGRRMREGLQIRALASSLASEELALQHGILLASFEETDSLDLYIDGADAVDGQHNLVKGGGGALVREKILAAASKRYLVIIDETKWVDNLAAFPLPVEVVPFGHSFTFRHLQSLGCLPSLRMREGKPFISDNGNLIIDCRFSRIEDPEALNRQINALPGVVETGLFPHTLVRQVITGFPDGTTRTS